MSGENTEFITFLAFDAVTKDYVGKQFKKSDLMKYPRSLLALIAFGSLKGNYRADLEAFVMKCTAQTIDNIEHFYKTGAWRNPHVSPAHRLEFDDIAGDFYAIITEYLNLPAIIEEPQDIDEEQKEVDEDDMEYVDDYPMGGLDDIDDDDGTYDAYGDDYANGIFDDREPGGYRGWEY